MKKIRISFLTILLVSLGFMAYSLDKANNYSNDDLLLSEVEALAEQGESGADILYCYCALMSDSNCAVNNHGSSKCTSGANVKCCEYNNNCN